MPLKQALPAAIAGSVLIGCSSAHYALNDLSRTLNDQPYDQATEDTPYNQTATANEYRVDRMRFVAKGQSTQAIHSALGSPNVVSEDREVYEIPGSSDGIHASRKFVVLYRPAASCSYNCYEAYDWYSQQGGN